MFINLQCASLFGSREQIFTARRFASLGAAAAACADESGNTRPRILFIRHAKQVSSSQRPLPEDKWNPVLSERGQEQVRVSPSFPSGTSLSPELRVL